MANDLPQVRSGTETDAGQPGSEILSSPIIRAASGVCWLLAPRGYRMALAVARVSGGWRGPEEHDRGREHRDAEYAVLPRRRTGCGGRWGRSPAGEKSRGSMFVSQYRLVLAEPETPLGDSYDVTWGGRQR